MLAVLLLLWAGLALYPETREAFLTAGNFSNLTAQISEIAIIGVGMTMVILIRGIDLSVGAGMALAGVVAAKLQIDHQVSAPLACLAVLAVTSLIGLWHGVLVSRFRIPPFVATLGGFMSYRGLALVLSGARGMAPMRDDFVVLGGRMPGHVSLAIVIALGALGLGYLIMREVRRKKLGLPRMSLVMLTVALAAILAGVIFALLIYQDGMPVPVLLAILVGLGGALLLSRSRLGRYAVAIGGNSEAARLSGVPVERVTVLIYLLTGALTGLAGIVATARGNGVTPGNAGMMRELHVITAVVIGGTSLSGGQATMVGTLIGALIFGTLSNGMNHLGINSDWQLIFTGIILLFASLLDSMSMKKRIS